MKNPIEQRKRMVQDRIEKSFTDGLNVSEEIEKASHGVYEDNAENRRKNRVGQEYGHAAQQKEPTGKTAGAAKTVDEHAAEASDKALERAAADKNASEEVRNAAQKELEKRSGSEKQPKQEEKPADKKSQEAKISETLTKMSFNGNQVHWPADLDISEVQKKYGFDLDDVFLDEKKNQFSGYAVKYEKDSSGRPVSKPFDAEQELGDIQAKAVRKAKKELKKRGGQEKTTEDKTENEVEEQPKTEENADSDFTEEDAKRFEELNSYIDDPKEKYSDKWYNALQEYRDLKERSFNHELKKDGLLNLDDFKDVNGIGTIHVSKTNDSRGNQIQTPYISITIDKKKDLKNFIKDVNSKLGTELSEDNFEFHPRDRYSSSYYEIAVNPKTKEFNTDSEIRKQIQDEHANKQREESEAKRLAQKKQTMNSLNGSNSFTKESLNQLFEDDETKGHAFSYFNYGDDEDCTPEEIEQFEKLKKMGAKTSDYFDWKESDEAETYEKKMQAKGYRLFDISTGDGYLWLMIKDKKLSKDVKKSIINDIEIKSVEEAQEILKGIE